MMIKRKLSLISLFLLLAAVSHSQDDDFGVWVNMTVRHGIIKNLDAELSGSIRTINNSSQIEQTFIEGGLQYDLSKYFSLSGYYRLINSLENDSKYYFRHRFALDFQGSVPVRNFSFSARARLQMTTKTYIEDDEDLKPYYYGRIKVKGAYKIPSFPLKPYLYYEPLVPLSSGSGFQIDRHRISAGAELQISMKSILELEYIFQRDYQPHISDINIASITYKLKF